MAPRGEVGAWRGNPRGIPTRSANFAGGGVVEGGRVAPRGEVGACCGNRGILQLAQQPVGHLAGVLVVDLVLEARPEVHRDRAELHLDGDLDAPAREEDGHLDDRVQALVAVRLRLGDVVLHGAHGDVVLLGEQVEQAVGILREARRDADAGDVGDRVPDAVERRFHALADDLVDQAVGALHAARHVFDRVVGVRLLELIAQDAELGLDLAQPELVVEQESLELIAHRAQLLG